METQYGSYFVAHRSLDISVRVSKTRVSRTEYTVADAKGVNHAPTLRTR